MIEAWSAQVAVRAFMSPLLKLSTNLRSVVTTSVLSVAAAGKVATTVKASANRILSKWRCCVLDRTASGLEFVNEWARMNMARSPG